MAIFEDVTTWAIVAEDRDRRPGVSTSMYIERGSMGREDEFIKPGNTVDIIARVSKIGKVFGFAEADAVDVKTGKIICSGRHIKYLPSASFIQDLALGPLFPLSKRFAESITDKFIDFKPTMDEILHFTEMSEDYKTGTQTVDECHHNPLKFYHGGCQAMAMEYMALNHASINSVNEKKMYTRSMSINYMSSGQNNVHFHSNVGNVSSNFLSVNLKINSSTGKPISEGIIHFENNKLE